MKRGSYGFVGANVDIEETITRHYEVVFLDYEIAKSMLLFNEKEKLKIIKYLIKLSGKKEAFHPIFSKLTKAKEREIIKTCQKSPKTWKKEDFLIID
ncbi:MAG: hypothetical protein IJ532_05150 [Alphaproteobacteria bacterium]|nr:hypothetical protein [Alphaproteobacteria bacterium]